MSSFNVKAEVDNERTILRFSGDIDENADFKEIDLSGVKELVIDLERVTLLNSSGLRGWVLWVKTIPKGTLVSYRSCPHFVVDQMNILEGFLPMGARVESFYVPYYCEACDQEEMVLARRGPDYMEGTADRKEGVLLPEQRQCPSCGGTAEMDVLAEKYFGFLKYRR